MPFRAGLKNSGKWYRINQLLRKHDSFKEAVNNDTYVQQELRNMDNVLQDEATKANAHADVFPAGGLVANGFPIPLRLWQGRLVYSKRGSGETGLTANQKNFRHYAYNLRKRVAELDAAFSALADAYDVDPAEFPNPGGDVDPGD